MSRPMTRLMTTAFATSTTQASARRWGLRGASTHVTVEPREAADTRDAEEPTPFWEYYCLAFC